MDFLAPGVGLDSPGSFDHLGSKLADTSSASFYPCVYMYVCVSLPYKQDEE